MEAAFSSAISTTDTSYNFASYFTRSGDYTFKVRAIYNTSNKGDWEESDELSVSSSEAKDIRDNGKSSGNTPSNSIDDDGGPGDTNTSQGAWLKNDTGWWYCNADRSYPVNQWQYINNYWYFFNASGYMVTGWYRKDANAPYVYYDPPKRGRQSLWTYDSKWCDILFYGYMRTDYAVVENGVFYYFGEDGALANQMNGVSDGWLLIGSDWYYVENGVLFGGLKTIGGATYYFDQGKMVTNARRMVHDSSSNTDKWYEFDANGHMIVGWSLDSDGIWYYYNSDGASASGMKTIGAATYYFAADGHMCTNYSVSIGEVMYYFGNDGVLSNTQSKPSDGWKLMTDGWYYFRNGSMIKSEFLTQGNITWYLDENGKMCTNQEKLIDGAWYRFDANGYMITGWYGANDGSWYYYGSNGQAGNGFTQIGNVWYYLE